MVKIKRIPYGKSDFEAINQKNDYYVDKTQYIPLLELTSFQFLIRPRRFGKSLFLSMLHSYYDINNIDRFDELFRETYILDNPTEEKTSYMILTFNFSAVDPDINRVEESFNTYCNIKIEGFVKRYSHILGNEIVEAVKRYDKPSEKLKYLSDSSKNIKTKLYMMIDEYDNFANTIISRYGQNSYENLTYSEGFFRYFFNVLKDMTSDSGSILARLFITGVSPITLDDVTSGFNIARNITIHENLNEILGFKQKDVEKILDYYISVGVFAHDREETLKLMKEWYGGYQFSKNGEEKIYNSDMILYYLMESYDTKNRLDDLVDQNVKIDYRKLQHFLTINKKLNGNFDALEKLLTDGKLSGDLVKSFPLNQITKRDNFISLLFYFGLITIKGTYQGEIEFIIPNNTIKTLIYSFIRDGYRDVYDFNIDVFELSKLSKRMLYRGEYENCFRFIEREINRVVVLRDFIDGERVIGAYFLSLLSITNSFIIEHEKQQSLGFSDMVLRPFYSVYDDAEYGYLIEFKYLSKKDYKESIKNKPLPLGGGLGEASLVNRYITQATKQLKRYEADDNFKKELQLAPYGDKKLIKLILLFVGGELKVLKEVKS